MGLSVLASPQFFSMRLRELTSIGEHPVPDFGGMTEIFSLVANCVYAVFHRREYLFI
ncbi:MAG: hypothetical protein AAGA50_16330 [Pseudomonadota bacterium]